MAKRSEAGGQGPVIQIPHDPFNEQIVIAAVLASARVRAKLVPSIHPDLFHSKGHPQIWTALRACLDKGLDPSIEALRQLGGKAIDAGYLQRLIEERPQAPPNMNHHVEVLKWDHARAEAARGPVSALLSSLQDPTTEPARVRALGRQVADSFEGHDGGWMHDPAQLVREQMAEVRARREGQALYPFGIEALDNHKDGKPRLIPGAKPGKTTLITAVSGAGKSTVTSQLMLGIARQRRRVLYGAWEQGGGVTLELMALQSLSWSKTRALTGQLTVEEEDQLQDRMLAISRYVRFWRLPFGRDAGSDDWTNNAALDAIRGQIADSACDVAVFDLFERCLAETRPEQERRALYRLATIADETQVHNVIVQQLRLKDVEQRADKRPTREAIFGTAAWTEVPDHILAVHNPALFKAVDNDLLYIYILKQRYGVWPQAIEFDWAPEKGLISNGRTVEYIPDQDDPSADPMQQWVEGARKGKR
jgi:replicative DNA helicase